MIASSTPKPAKRTSMRRRLSRIRSDEGGATLVEFGFVIGPLMVLIISTLDLGYRAYVDVQAGSAAYEVARLATTGGIDVSQVEGRVEELMDPILLNGSTLTVEAQSYFDFTGIGRAETITVDNNSNNRVDNNDCFIDENDNAQHDPDVGRSGIGGANDVVLYTITVDSPNLTPIASLIGIGDTFSVRAQSTGRNQPYADQDQVEKQEYCIQGGTAVAV